MPYPLEIAKGLKNGLFSSSQVSSCKNQLSEMLSSLNGFDPHKLNMIAGYSFDSLKKQIQASISSVEGLGKQKDLDFQNLFSVEISTIEDLDRIISESSDLVLFYKGMGDIKSDNLEDAEIMKREALLLKDAFTKLKNERLSIKGVQEVLESSKEELSQALSGDAIYDDESILEEYAAECKKSIEIRSLSWLKNQEKALNSCANTQDINRVLFSLEAVPNYAKGSVEKGINVLYNQARMMASSMKMDYIKDLFVELSDKDKLSFIDWCKKQSK